MNKDQADTNWLANRPSRMYRYTEDASDEELAQRQRYGDEVAATIRMSRISQREQQAKKNEILAEAKAAILMDKMAKENKELERELG